MRGLRPWDQFLNYCDVVAQVRGGRLHAAQLTDPRYRDEIKKRLAESDGKSTRPPLLGHTAEVDALYMVANQIRLLIRANGGEIEFIDGPEGPADLIQQERTAVSLSLVDAALG